MKFITTTVFLIFVNLPISFSQINYSIKDGIELLISNPSFIESSLDYEGYKYASTEAKKFHKYIHKENNDLDFVYTSVNGRIEVISWSSILSSENYKSLLNEIKKINFIEASERISNYTDFNSSSQQFVNLEMNCTISLVRLQTKLDTLGWNLKETFEL